MSGFISILILVFALYGVASLIWELNDTFLKPKSRNSVCYLAFLPLGDENEIEQEVRSCIDYAQEIGCEPVLLFEDSWSDEKTKIAFTICEKCDLYIHMI